MAIATKKYRILYTVARKYESAERFDKLKKDIDIVCAGDSLTGWNNHLTHPTIWPFPTYPKFLQDILNENDADLHTVNAGIAGATSNAGLFAVMSCLEQFENAQVYIIGFGANDLGQGTLTEFDKSIGLTEKDIYKPSLKETTEKAIENIDIMVESILAEGKKPILINVPNVNESVCPPERIPELRAKRDHYNKQVADYFAGKAHIVNIRSKLKDEHFGDSVHTTEEGAKIIAEAVFSELKKYLN